MILWEQYQTVKFKPRAVDKSYEKGNCGAQALALITGISVWKIDKCTPKQGWWDDASMVKFLKKHGFICIEITSENIQSRKDAPTNTFDNGKFTPAPSYYVRHPNHLNVLLISQHTTAHEGSWAVVHNHRYQHNSEREFFSGYELIVNPLWTGYVIFHPKWKTSEDKKREALRRSWVGMTNSTNTSLDMFHPKTAHWFEVPITDGKKRKRLRKRNKK